MQRDRLLLTEIIDAAERIIDLAAARSADDFVADRDRRDALLWNYTVLGEAIGQLSDEMKSAHPSVAWAAPRSDAQPHRSRVLVGRCRCARDDRADRSPSVPDQRSNDRGVDGAHGERQRLTGRRFNVRPCHRTDDSGERCDVGHKELSA